MPKVETGVRAEGGGKYSVYLKFPHKSPTSVATYKGAGRAETALAHAQAEAHVQGIRDGLSAASDLIKGMIP